MKPMCLFIGIFMGCLLTLITGQAESVLSAVVQEDAHYRLDTGDRILINVVNERNLTFEISLNASGVIEYPYLGSIRAKGMTTRDLQETIHRGLLGKYLVDPNVQVRIVSYRSFYIRGEVANPGSYAWSPGLTIEKAITIAGGYTERATKKRFELIRSEKKVPVGLDSPMQPGDMLRIPRSLF